MIDRDALRAEALRIHGRYVVEVVEAFGFCPWAAEARAQGRVQTRVLLADAHDPRSVVEQIVALEREHDVDIGLLVFPELSLDRLAFQHFAAEVRTGYAPRPGQARFAIADFHPAAEPDFASPARLVPFIRRSPDPTLQLVRSTAIEQVRLGGESGTRFVDPGTLDLRTIGAPPSPPDPLHERVARANLKTVRALGLARVLFLLTEIERDRDDSYARLGLAPPPWRAPEREL